MYVLRVSHPNDLDRVCVFLRGVHLRVETNEDGSISATAPGAPTPEHERREVSGYVTTWNALNPANPVAIVELEA
ncbi:MAG: hypothetical protein QOH16_1833 [Gaiellaceae bacterium]|nr:hypothetical protein [Gaiellaceae bacterium]